MPRTLRSRLLQGPCDVVPSVLSAHGGRRVGHAMTWMAAKATRQAMPTWTVRNDVEALSLIHISEPTRPRLI
eukprot:3824740-Amphidinium_carterae.2